MSNCHLCQLSQKSGYVETFKVKDGDKDKYDKLLFFCIYDENLFEIYKAVWTKIEDLKNSQ